MTYPLLLLLMTVATYRITRVVVEDTFPPVQWVRDRVTGERQPVVQRWRWVPDWLGELVGCSWCASVWVAAGVVTFTLPWASIPLPVLTWLAVAAGAAWISHLEEYLTREQALRYTSDAQDDLRLALRGARERLCAAQMLVSDGDRDTLQGAVDRIDLVARDLTPEYDGGSS